MLRRWFAVSLLACLGAAVAFAATRHGHVIVRDVVTHYAVRAKIKFEGPKSLSVEADATGNVSLDLPPGQYRTEISAPGYKTLRSRQTVELGKKWGGFIMLDPANPPEEEQSINSELRAAYTLLHGYATNDEGRPVEGVAIRLLGAGAHTSTNQRGYFELSVPTPALDADTDTLVAEKPGYKTVVHKNFIVEGEDGGTVTLDLERGAGKIEFDDTPAIRKNAEATDEQTPYVR